MILRLSLIIEMFDKYWPSGNRSIDVLFTKSAANVIGAGLGVRSKWEICFAQLSYSKNTICICYLSTHCCLFSLFCAIAEWKYLYTKSSICLWKGLHRKPKNSSSMCFILFYFESVSWRLGKEFCKLQLSRCLNYCYLHISIRAWSYSTRSRCPQRHVSPSTARVPPRDRSPRWLCNMQFSYEDDRFHYAPHGCVRYLIKKCCYLYRDSICLDT